MNVLKRIRDTMGLVCLGPAMWIALVGCSSIRPSAHPSPSGPMPAERGVRKEDAVKQFEAARDRAQLEAARAAIAQNDLPRATAELRALTRRSPDNTPARLLLAEVCLWSEQPEQARSELESLLAAGQSTAAVHDLMGQALESLGHPREAQQHFARAVELAPSSELYRRHRDEWTALLPPATGTQPAMR